MTSVEKMEEFLIEQRLWYVERMDEERGPVEALHIEVDGTKKRKIKRDGKKRWNVTRLPEVCKGWMHKIMKDGD